MASPLTVYADAADGGLRCASSTYELARAGTGTMASDTKCAGQTFLTPTFYNYESFYSFITSDIGADSTVTVATFYIGGATDTSTTDFTVEVYAKDWGATLETTDWLAAGSAGTRLAYYAISGTNWAGALREFTSDAAFLAAINKTGTTYLVCLSDRAVDDVQPSGDEYVFGRFSEYTGTDQDPKLYVEYTTGVAPTLTTTEVSDITDVTAASGGVITDAGSDAVTDYGVVWATHTAPVIETDDHTHDKP